MQFTRSGSLIRVVRISGPTHNLLGLRLAVSEESADVQMEALPGSGAPQLGAADVSREVCAGVEEEGRALGVHLRVRHIQYLPSDSGPPSEYRDLARSLVRHYAADLSQGQRAA